MGLPVWVVDAFTAEPFAGNPAAVCLLDRPRDDAWMQRVAAEMRHSETAFLLREGPAWRLRWFTPKVEVDLCGHATLAAAHVLFAKRRGAGGSGVPRGDDEIRFLTRGGELKATADGPLIALDFPALPVGEEPPPPGLLEALGARPRFAGRSRFDRLLELESEEAVRALEPDFRALGRVDTRGVIVTARGTRHDFVSRFFCPAVGIDEDPVTGSAHCALAPFWAARLGRGEMTGFQASPRGGEVRVRVAGDRVLLSGRAVTVLRGELTA